MSGPVACADDAAPVIDVENLELDMAVLAMFALRLCYLVTPGSALPSTHGAGEDDRDRLLGRCDSGGDEDERGKDSRQKTGEHRLYLRWTRTVSKS